MVNLITLATSVLAFIQTASSSSGYIQYSTVEGVFAQDNNSTNATTFDYTQTNFGLLNRTYPSDTTRGAKLTQWQHFAIYVKTLNQQASTGTRYTVLFMGRHGEGYHNAAETYYGTPAWNCYQSLLNGNSTVTWADAHLTPKGIAQAQVANTFWQHEIAVQKIPVPDSYYTSPLYRCLSTANVTFGSLNATLPPHKKFIPTIKELLREGISLHTCDRRSNRTFITTSFPTYRVEPGFVEHDPLFDGVTAETSNGQDVRSLNVLNDIFSHDKSTYISITSHSGEIASILRVLGHIPFSLNTGAVIPVLVKAVTVNATSTATATDTRTSSYHCTTSPPVTSISGGACVCPNSAAPVDVPLVTGIP